MQPEDERVQHQADHRVAPADLGGIEAVAALQDGKEREVGGGRGKALPILAERCLLAPVHEQGAQRGKHEDEQTRQQARALTARPADLAVLDVKMPRMDGMELLQRLRSSPVAAN